MDTSTSIRRSALLGLTFMTSLVAGCGGDNDNEPTSEVFSVIVDDTPTLCSGLLTSPVLCPPLAYRVGTNEVETQSASIAGFEHEFGVAYELRIEMTPIAEPQADGPDREYQLLEVLESTQIAEVGDAYEYELTLHGFNFEIVDDTYFIGSYAFECAEDVDCEQLIEMDGSDGIVNIELTYTGNAIPITLTFWN